MNMFWFTDKWLICTTRPNCLNSFVLFFRLQLIYAIYLFYGLNITIKYLIMAHYNLTIFSPIIVNNYFIKRNQDCHVQTLPPIFLFFFFLKASIIKCVIKISQASHCESFHGHGWSSLLWSKSKRAGIKKMKACRKILTPSLLPIPLPFSKPFRALWRTIRRHVSEEMGSRDL